MASRRPTGFAPETPILTVEQKRRRIQRLQDGIQGLEAFDPQTVQKRQGSPEILALRAAIQEALSAAFGDNTPAYLRYRDAATLAGGPSFARLAVSGRSINNEKVVLQARQCFAESKQKSIALLQQAIHTLKDEIVDQEQLASPPSEHPAPKMDARKVFVVHGHDEAALQAVARFLERLELDAIILREQPDQGRTTIEKFEACAGEVGFAVALLTPDDLAGTAGEPTQGSRARQNVIFELGYFVGRLGRGRACLLRKGQVEIPSDLYGVIYSDLDTAEGWKLKLLKELKAANLDFDASRMW